MLDAQQDLIRDLKEMFNNAPNLVGAIKKQIEENGEIKKQIAEFKAQQEQSLKQKFLENATEIKGIKVVRIQAPLEADSIKNIAFQLRAEHQNLIVVAGTEYQGKPLLTVAISDDVKAQGYNAGQLVKDAAKLIQGGGGGQPHFAQAGGKNAEGLSNAVNAILDAIKA